MRTLLLAAFMAACSSPARPADTARSTTPVPSESPPDTATPDSVANKLGGPGAVCKLGTDHEQAGGPDPSVQCAAGLSCCYPCGDKGCDFTCMTPEECSVKRP